MHIDEAVAKDTEIMSGVLCFRGTRVPVHIFFNYLEGGTSVDGFLETYAWIERDKVMTVFEHAQIT